MNACDSKTNQTISHIFINHQIQSLQKSSALSLIGTIKWNNVENTHNDKSLQSTYAFIFSVAAKIVQLLSFTAVMRTNIMSTQEASCTAIFQ